MNIAIIFAGGVGKRMNSKAIPKQFLRVHDKPIIIHTIEKFEKCASVDKIIVVCVEEWIGELEKLVKQYALEKISSIVPHGATGQLSIYNGLAEAKNKFGVEDNIAIIHDGVRPIIDSKLITDNINCAIKYGSAISASKVTETIVLREGENIGKTVDRDKSWTAKAPQSFKLSDILECHLDAIAKGNNKYIDSATIMQDYGYSLRIVECDSSNIKITTATDFIVFKAMIEEEERKQIL